MPECITLKVTHALWYTFEQARIDAGEDMTEARWQAYRQAVFRVEGRYPEELELLEFHMTHTKEQINKHWLRHTGRSWTGD